MTKRARRTHSPVFKAKVALAAIKGTWGKTPGRSTLFLFPDAVSSDSLPVCRRLPIYPTCREPNWKLGCWSFLARCRN
jgi:hypothetical protein